MRRVLLDTGPWLALFHSADQHHQRTVDWLRREAGAIRLLSSWPVLTEVSFFLRATTKQRVLEWIERGAVELIDLDDRDRRAIHTLLGRYADQRPDLADASLLAIAERLGINEIATFDRKDFATYRIGRDGVAVLTDFSVANTKPRQGRR